MKPAPIRPPLDVLLPIHTELGGTATHGRAADGQVYAIGASEPIAALANATSMATGAWCLLSTEPCEWTCATLRDGSLLCEGATAKIPGLLAGRDCPNPEYCSYSSNGSSMCGTGFLWSHPAPTYKCLDEWTLVPDAPKLRQLEETCGVDFESNIPCWNSMSWLYEPSPTTPNPANHRSGEYPKALREHLVIFANGTLVDLKTGTPVPGIGPVVDACGALDVSCALTVEQDVYCWGTDLVETGVGDGSIGRRDTPVWVGSGYVALDCAPELWCAIDSNGGVDCWGSGVGGEPCGFQNESRCALRPRSTGIIAKQVVVEGIGRFLVLRRDGSVAEVANGRTTILHPTR